MSVSRTSFTKSLRGFIKFNLVFETVTGLLIRMPLHEQMYRIGGANQYPIVTRKRYSDVEIDVPYVPGSSLKGRMRSLLELSMGLKVYTTDKKIWQHVRNLEAMEKEFFDDVLSRCVIDELFGWAAANYEQIKEKIEKLNLKQSIDVDKVFSILAPTRLLVVDFFPTEEYVKRNNISSLTDFLEEKSENRIDRITSAADPRDIVRVKPGVEFGGSITITLFEHDKDMVRKYLQTLATGLKLVEETYLGGSGSRGYGRIRFKDIEVNLLKVEVRDGAPSLVDTDVKKRYSSVDDLLRDVESLANAIVTKVFG